MLEFAIVLEMIKLKNEMILKNFSGIWQNLWESPIHLDSALSKLPTQTKSILAQILPVLLMRPASQAEALGIGVMEGEPWSLDLQARAGWRPAFLIAERMYELMVQGFPSVEPMKEDFPPEMIREWQKDWGEETLHQLIDSLGRAAPMSLRASQRVGASAVLQGLNADRPLPVRSELSHFLPFGIRLAGYAPVLNTDLYRSGAFEIQDEGSQLMAVFALWPDRFGGVLSDRPGKLKLQGQSSVSLPEAPALNVVDACAGAGGKSLALADALKGKGRVYAYDTSEKKLQALRRRATRAQLNNIQTIPVQEGKEVEVVAKFKRSADLVLVDAPCSGWGVLRRNPDIKWRQKPDVLERMPAIQSRILSEYSSLVKPGGRLVFGVCTFRLAETQEVVSRFLESHPEFSKREGGYLGPGPTDGFFMQSFVREA